MSEQTKRNKVSESKTTRKTVRKPARVSPAKKKLALEVIERLKKDVAFSLWERVDESHMAVRFCTSWSTTDEQLDALEKLL